MTGDPGPASAEPGATSRTMTWAVASFICLGAFLRVYRFWSSGLWTDEYGTWWVVAPGEWSELVHRAVHIQGQSPFYYLIVKLSTRLLGTGPFSLRLPSIVFGIATLALAYPLGRALFRQRYAGLFTVAAFAVSAPLIWYSQEARPYSLALFGAVLSFLCYLRLLERDSWRWRAAYVVATAAVFYAHYVFAFVVVVQVAHLLVVRGRSWLSSRAWPVTWFVLVHLFVAYLDLPLLIVLAVVTVLIGFDAEQRRQLFDRVSVSLLAVWFVLPIVVFSGAPLTANLRPGHRYVMLGLPFRVNDQTLPYVDSLMARVASRRRVLIIGLGEAVPLVATTLISSGAFTPAAVTPHGMVSVIVLEQRAR